MKKSSFFLIVLLFTGIVTTQAQLKFGLKAGVNLSNVSLDGRLKENFKVDNLTGFQVGPMVEFIVPVIGFGFDAAVLYSNEGFKLNAVTFENLGTTIQTEAKSYKSNNLLVPVNLKYKKVFMNVAGVYVSAGPYAKFNLDGDVKDKYESKSFGAGLNFGFGVELLNHLQVGVNYQLGLTEDYSALKVPGLQHVPNIIDDIKAQPRVWSVTAAYFF
ncbi:MAG: PorT family protein [Dysgonamonadaceae bacterium]|jgi:hypothetical protein|nr:PorT family protein [Dysgonamonadaceae bacterium]